MNSHRSSSGTMSFRSDYREHLLGIGARSAVNAHGTKLPHLDALPLISKAAERWTEEFVSMIDPRYASEGEWRACDSAMNVEVTRNVKAEPGACIRGVSSSIQCEVDVMYQELMVKVSRPRCLCLT